MVRTCPKQLISILTAVLLRLGETARTARINAASDICIISHHQWAVKEMVARMELTIRTTSVHVGQILLHLCTWEHGYVLQAERLEYVALKVLVQGQLRRSFHADTSPVYANLNCTSVCSSEAI